MQHEQDAVEGGLIAHCELACATFGGGSEGGDQGLQLQPQFFANGLSCHEGMKHNCFMRVSWAVVLATLSYRLRFYCSCFVLVRTGSGARTG